MKTLIIVDIHVMLLICPCKSHLSSSRYIGQNCKYACTLAGDSEKVEMIFCSKCYTAVKKI